jgi:hypothetical protein
MKGLQPPLRRDNVLEDFPVLDLTDVGPEYFDELGALLKAYPPSEQDALDVAAFRDIGVGPGLAPSKDPKFRELLSQGVKNGLKSMRDHGVVTIATPINGWYVLYNVTNFIRDPQLRAACNQLGPGININLETLYFTALNGPDGKPLRGDVGYKLVFPAGSLPPVDAFWAVSLYDPNFFLVDNPIHRYSVSDRTKGLIYGADGSLEIHIQHNPPASGTSNWLPAPEGPFVVLNRAYQPRPELLKGIYKFPRLQNV